MLKFEWNQDKATSNQEKHGVDFEEASSVFNDPLAQIFEDNIHSINEKREIIIGYSSSFRLLIVSFTERGKDILRIISARKATIKEKYAYEENT